MEHINSQGNWNFLKAKLNPTIKQSNIVLVSQVSNGDSGGNDTHLTGNVR